MYPIILSMSLIAAPQADESRVNDVRSLVATIESLQGPVEDFRCEFEGTIRYQWKHGEDFKLGDAGSRDSFSGIFLWRKGGDTYSDSLYRDMPAGTIVRDTLVVRMWEGKAEQYNRTHDAPRGLSLIQKPKDVDYSGQGRLGQIFIPINRIEQHAADARMETSVHDDQIEGRPLKVLEIKVPNLPESFLMSRYWIDLHRNGHVVRCENYASGEVVSGRLDIKLAPFKVGDAEVWMPVRGESVGYAALVDRKPVITTEPTSYGTISVVDGTMQFNKRPGREAFTIKHKPGAPISDDLRKLTYEFGRQKIAPRPTKAAAERSLNEQLAKAEAQRSELVAVPASQRFDWSSWTIGGVAVIALVSTLFLWMQMRGH